jgi:hypothetical protein
MPSPYSAPAKTLRLGDALELGGSLFVFAFSFAPFVTISVPTLIAAGLADWQNAWATETFMAPLTWFVVLAGLLQIGAVVLRYLRGHAPGLLGFRLPQLEVGLGLFMLVVLFGMVTSEKHVIFGAKDLQPAESAELSVGWGAILMLIGALAAAVGGVLTHLSVGPVIVPRPAGPVPPPAAGPAYSPAGEPYPPAAGQPQPPAAAGQPQPPAPAGQPQPPASNPPQPPSGPASSS